MNSRKTLTLDKQIDKLKKFKQMYLYILSKFDEYGVQKIKLAMLLYLSDFRHFYENLESMSGVLYRCSAYGPLADSFLDLTDEMVGKGEIKVSISEGTEIVNITNKIFNNNFDLLSIEERKEIDEICKKWKNQNIEDISKYIRRQKPWMACREDEIIPYSLILQEDPKYLY